MPPAATRPHCVKPCRAAAEASGPPRAGPAGISATSSVTRSPTSCPIRPPRLPKFRLAGHRAAPGLGGARMLSRERRTGPGGRGGGGRCGMRTGGGGGAIRPVDGSSGRCAAGGPTTRNGGPPESKLFTCGRASPWPLDRAGAARRGQATRCRGPHGAPRRRLCGRRRAGHVQGHPPPRQGRRKPGGAPAHRRPQVRRRRQGGGSPAARLPYYCNCTVPRAVPPGRVRPGPVKPLF